MLLTCSLPHVLRGLLAVGPAAGIPAAAAVEIPAYRRAPRALHPVIGRFLEPSVLNSGSAAACADFVRGCHALHVSSLSPYESAAARFVAAVAGCSEGAPGQAETCRHIADVASVLQ